MNSSKFTQNLSMKKSQKPLCRSSLKTGNRVLLSCIYFEMKVVHIAKNIFKCHGAVHRNRGIFRTLLCFSLSTFFCDSQWSFCSCLEFLILYHIFHKQTVIKEAQLKQACITFWLQTPHSYGSN